MSKKYLLIILVASLSVLFTVLVLKNHNNLSLRNKVSLKTNSNVTDISDKFVITPNKEYSLSDKNIVIPADKYSVPGIPERIGVKAKVYNSFSKPLWVKGKDCNYHGVLEKKTIMGWVVADEETCQQTKQSIPGRSLNNGADELYHVIFTKDAKGSYRMRINLLYGCKASKNSEGNIVYDNCENEVVSYSSVFSIID